MKKILSIVLAVLIVVMILSFSGCSNNSVSSNKSLYDHGLELVNIVDEMAESESYVQIYTGSPKIIGIVADFGKGDYSEPKAVYKLMPEAAFLTEYGQNAELEEMSEKVKKIISDKATAALISQTNAIDGAENLAATTVCAAGKTFVNSEIKDNVIYIYTCENGYPVAVTFTAGEDSTVSASAMFVSCSVLSTASADDIEEFFGGCVTVEKIK